MSIATERIAGKTAADMVTAMNKANEPFIAVPAENGQIYKHFGNAEHFSLYETEHGKIRTVTSISHNSIKRGALVGMLKMLGVDTVICDEAGTGVQTLMSDNGMTLYSGVTGSADEAVRKFLNVSL